MSKSTIPAVALRSNPSIAGDFGLIGALAQTPSQVFGTLLVWQMRARQRARLANLERHRLEDMGITPEQAGREARKPFWRA
jgi:uncharacterized protein YjiS (DUF1127 family)